MSKPFKVRMQEILDEIKETSKVKKMKSTFSRKMLTEVTEAMLNDVEYTINTYGLKGGKYNVEEVMPVKEFRKRLLGPILERTNMDKEDIEKFLEIYQFTPQQADSLYNLYTSIIYEYIKTGKNFKLLPTEDFVGTIYARKVKEKKVTNKDGSETICKEHYCLGKRSGCPKWLRVK